MLEALASSDDPALAARAREALALDERVRRARRGIADAHDAAGLRSGSKVRRGRPARRTADAPAVLNREIHDAKNGTDLPGTLVRSEGDPATDDVAATEAYDGLGATWTMWHEVFNRNSLDGRGLTLSATVHYSRDYDNAFWDGTQMVFGDGDGQIFGRFTKSLDVIGHELAHGVTEHTAGLMYQGQAGALNESMSDVFGALVVQHSRSQSAEEADWLIGADLLMPGVKGRALRDMRNPGTAYDDPELGKDPQPASMDDYVTTDSDHGGVHINSGIPNRAFVLAALALGGNAWETVGPVWYAVLTGDGISADCDFETFAGLTVAAAEKLHGAGSEPVAAVRTAWETVGVLEPSEPGSPDGTGSAPQPDPKGEPDPRTPKPGPDEPAPVTLTRTGGITGRTKRADVHLQDLPDEAAGEWTSLLGSNTLQRIAARAPEPQPDAFCYGVCYEPQALDVTLPEPELPDRVKDLFERTLRSPQPRRLE